MSFPSPWKLLLKLSLKATCMNYATNVQTTSNVVQYSCKISKEYDMNIYMYVTYISVGETDTK